MESTENKQPEHDALIVQLTELNNRSRWYTAQLWHIPFAYFGILVVALAQIKTNKTSYFSYILLFIGFFGCFALWHMYGLINGVERAVRELQKIENQLNLRQTAQFRVGYIIPLFIALIIAIWLCIGFGIYLL
jgi:hypothetical protein